MGRVGEGKGAGREGVGKGEGKGREESKCGEGEVSELR